MSKIKVKESPIKFALMAPGLTKAEAEALRKRYKRRGVRYTQVKKSPYTSTTPS